MTWHGRASCSPSNSAVYIARLFGNCGSQEAFRSINHDDPEIAAFISLLSKQLPDGFAAVAFLDWANHSLINGKLTHHPFNQPTGIARLATYLTDHDPEHFSQAVSATAALPFVNASAELFTLAAKHPDRHVRIEAAWAAAKSGDLEHGRALLVRHNPEENWDATR